MADEENGQIHLKVVVQRDDMCVARTDFLEDVDFVPDAGFHTSHNE